MDLFFQNTLTRRKERLIPLREGRISIYSCGPTVYSRQHIGNMRAAIFVDVLKRALRFNGYDVTDVVNITDVGHLVSDEDRGEDKMQKAAREQNKDPYEIARFWEEAYVADLKALNVMLPKHLPRATEHIAEQLAFITAMEKNGFTYTTSDGVYFDTHKLPDYGKLSRQPLESKEAGARIAVDTEKRNPTDFALWKFLTKENKDHAMQWPSPWGAGFPGWHLECSAMSHKYLGSGFDIHTGGIEHIPVHHENEIAQNEGSGLITHISFWIHNEHLLMDGGKMAKSLGNVFNLDDLKARGISPLSFRYFVLGAHYRSPLNFTWEALEGAQTALSRLAQTFAEYSNKETLSEPDKKYIARFTEYINDDLDTPRALALLWELVKDGGIPATTKQATILGFDTVLGLGLSERKEDLAALSPEEEVARADLPSDIVELLAQREGARSKKEWGKADKIRGELEKEGYILKDTPDGVKIYRQEKK